MDLCNDNVSTENKVCSKSDQIINTIVLLAKSECHQIMIDNEYSINIETLNPFCRTYFISPIEFEYINLSYLASCLVCPDDYYGVILTSKRCVDALLMSLKLMPEFPYENLSKFNKFFTVGIATKQYLYEKFKLDSIGHHTGNSEALAQFILDWNKEANIKKPLLYPCSKIRSDPLMDILKNHIEIKEIICYDTVPNKKINEHLHQFKLFLLEHLKKFKSQNDEIEQFKLIIVFFSSSGVDNLINPIKKQIIEDDEIIKNLSIKYVAFGKQTAIKLKDHGFDVWFVVSAPNSKSLAKDLNDFLVDKPPHVVLLESWLNKSLKIKLSDNRIIVGIFLCTDCHQNIILGSSSEYLNDDDEDYRTLGPTMVPGEHIVSIAVDQIVPT